MDARRQEEMINTYSEFIDDDYDPEIEDLIADERAQKRYHNQLMRHPDCSDPDHPGCEVCEEPE